MESVQGNNSKENGSEIGEEKKGKRKLDVKGFDAKIFKEKMAEAIEEAKSGIKSRSPLTQKLYEHRDMIREALNAGVGSRRITDILEGSGVKVSETSVKTFIKEHVLKDDKKGTGQDSENMETGSTKRRGRKKVDKKTESHKPDENQQEVYHDLNGDKKVEETKTSRQENENNSPAIRQPAREYAGIDDGFFSKSSSQ